MLHPLHFITRLRPSPATLPVAFAACALFTNASAQTAPPVSQPAVQIADHPEPSPTNPYFPPGTDPLRPPGTPEGYVLLEGCILVPDRGYGARSYDPGSAWPDGIIPFEFDPAISNTNRSHMLHAMSVVSATAANINFVYRANQPTYVYITASTIDGVSYSAGLGVDPATGPNVVAITDSGWDNTFHVAHELMHRLGFYHEQSRPDRDQYVRIESQNFSSPDDAYQFRLANGSDMLGTPYDYRSIMHYSACAFSSCSSCSSSNASCRTITTLNSGYQSVIGNTSGWGDYDELDLQLVYGVGACAYVRSPGNPFGQGTIESPSDSVAGAAALVPNGTVWCERSAIFPNVGTLSTPVTLKSHGPGPGAILD